jgi:hypothetical protein
VSGWATQRAEQLIADLGITAPADLSVEDIAWERGALVRDELLEGSVARLIMFGRRGMITVSTTIREVGRRRFAIAHELGHLEMHRGTSDLNLCLESDIEPRWRRREDDPEQEANEFASGLLMPERLFTPRCDKKTPSLSLVESLASEFITSLTATAVRYAELSREPCAVVYSQARQIKWYRASKDFGFHVRVGEEVDRYSIADDCFAGRATPGRATSVDASCWFAPGRFKDDAMIKEDSRAFPNYNAVLTLLWIDQDIEREDEPRESFSPDGRWRRK